MELTCKKNTPVLLFPSSHPSFHLFMYCNTKPPVRNRGSFPQGSVQFLAIKIEIVSSHTIINIFGEKTKHSMRCCLTTCFYTAQRYAIVGTPWTGATRESAERFRPRLWTKLYPSTFHVAI